MVLAKIYIDSCIIADWILVEAISERHKKRLRKSVKLAHKLMNRLLSARVPIALVVSEWAIIEAINIIKREAISIKMVFANIPCAYYQEITSDEEFKISTEEEEIIIEVFKYLKEKLTGKKSQLISKIEFKTEELLKIITELCLSANDALHLYIALRNSCDVMITRDRHFLDLKDRLSSRIKIYSPLDFFDEKGKIIMPNTIPVHQPLDSKESKTN